MAYYDNLSNAIDKLKRSLPDRTHKKTITYITNDGSRRSTYSKRGTSLVLSAMELELQTHCAVSVEVKPSWVKGKCHSYRSENKELAGAEDQTSVPTVQERWSMTD
ncbi:uncharacterized protein [Mytilus edulis]|uniref:uncharacterized protein n=1 Tax=Mytilus edulis TaxID=6550 RepID=UPI0039EFA79A